MTVPSAHFEPEFAPFELLPLLIPAVLYWWRAAHLAERGRPVSVWRQASFGSGLLLIAGSLVGLGELADELFWPHMLEHLLIGDLAAILLVLGLTGPLLQPILAIKPFDRLRVLAHPAIALPLWAVDLYVWHIPLFYDGALHHDSVHAVEHLLFFTCGCLMWEPVVETLPAPQWFGTGVKLGYVAFVRLVEAVLGNVFIWSGTAFYSVYRHAPEWGITPVHDLNLAGIVMMGEGSIVTIAVLVWLFLKLAAESELRQQLLEQGLDPRQVRRAVRYGRAGGLSL